MSEVTTQDRIVVKHMLSVLSGGSNEYLYPMVWGAYSCISQSTPPRARTYHNLAHLARLWCTLYEWNYPNVASAAFVTFHDYVFRSIPDSPGQNEFESINVFLNFGPDHLPVRDSGLVTLGISATARHLEHQPYLPPEVLYWLDADLVSLADEPECFRQNSEDIRLETGLAVDSPLWINGRRHFLATLLKRPSLFYTNEAQHLEAPARINIIAALQELGG